MAGRTIPLVDQAAFAHQDAFQHELELGEDANLVRHLYLCADRDDQEGTSTRGIDLHIATDSLRKRFRENLSKEGVSLL